ncbi:MAG: hypothetical protein J6V73_00745, partial [Spirochaetaceae bacterium]|nr:hypothetical protein [Spirochaetaceae bacterium]
MKNISIRWKITLPIITGFIIVVAGLTIRISVNFFNKYNQTSKKFAVETASRYAADVSDIIENYEHITNEIGNAVESFIDNGLTDRRTIVRFLQKEMKELPKTKNMDGWDAIWLMFEPNELDGKD